MLPPALVPGCATRPTPGSAYRVRDDQRKRSEAIRGGRPYSHSFRLKTMNRARASTTIDTVDAIKPAVAWKPG
jgi:hypothetical protein